MLRNKETSFHDIAVFVLKRDVKLQPINRLRSLYSSEGKRMMADTREAGMRWNEMGESGRPSEGY